MSVIGIGVDVIECSRIQRSIERFGDRFLHRVFTDGEIEYSMSMKFPERHLAARFAGKEAAAKAFGTGIGKAMGWRNIHIRKKESGEPFLVFTGPTEASRQNGASRRRLSLLAILKITPWRALLRRSTPGGAHLQSRCIKRGFGVDLSSPSEKRFTLSVLHPLIVNSIETRRAFRQVRRSWRIFDNSWKSSARPLIALGCSFRRRRCDRSHSASSGSPLAQDRQLLFVLSAGHRPRDFIGPGVSDCR